MNKFVRATKKRPGLRALAIVMLVASCPASAETAVDKMPPPEPVVDPAPCLAAVSANNDDAVIAACAALIVYAKATLPDRIKALTARAAAYTRKDQIDLAIADYDAVLKIDPVRADLFNARGELWRQKGERPRAIRDFAAAMKLDPQNETARSNHKALALEIERMGAAMAIKDQPKPPLK